MAQMDAKGQELQEVVSVRDGIQAVSIDGGEMEVLCFFERIGVIGCTRQSACSDRGHVAGFVAVFEAFEVSFEHGKVCQACGARSRQAAHAAYGYIPG